MFSFYLRSFEPVLRALGVKLTTWVRFTGASSPENLRAAVVSSDTLRMLSRYPKQPFAAKLRKKRKLRYRFLHQVYRPI